MVGSTTILKFTYHDYLDEVFQRQMYESALRGRPHQGLQQEVLHRLPGEGVRLRGAPQRPAGADLPRHRSLQEDQRHPRPPGRRLRAGRALADDGRSCCGPRTCWPASAARSSPSSAAARIRPAPRSSPSGCGAPSRSASSPSAARTSQSPSAWGSPPSPRAASRPCRLSGGRRQGALRGQAQRPKPRLPARHGEDAQARTAQRQDLTV